ncbi:hypothetical protein EBBID32_36580 [Sphingobium indicum BiD32]|uniref:Uncharacterized protein n=1 Tax=Sphingobium indicum BiD32 TaxID=1301087 RepID=N1MUJ2_9SPHN|nr:hypothetical protein [Sphingobium indicum]CCW19292.1 hypothetical protein EBBID32_36580 [Sphingobium indicum BiD32]
MKKHILVGLLSLVAAVPSQAQNVYHFYGPENNSGAGVRYFLPSGYPVVLRTRTQVSTKDNKPGDRVYLEVAENVMFRDQVIIPVGSPVTAEVAATQRNGHFGKKGKIEIQLIEAMTPNGPVKLSGLATDEGKSGTAASVATILLVSPLGFLIHGTSAYIAPGTVVHAQTNSDLKFRWYPRNESADQAAPIRAANPNELALRGGAVTPAQ